MKIPRLTVMAQSPRRQAADRVSHTRVYPISPAHLCRLLQGSTPIRCIPSEAAMKRYISGRARETRLLHLAWVQA